MTVHIENETSARRDQGLSVAAENEAAGTAHAIAPAAPPATRELVLKPDDIEQEPLLKPNLRRFTLFPIQYPDVWEAYKRVRFLMISAKPFPCTENRVGRSILLDSGRN
jgi:hypothetical protein